MEVPAQPRPAGRSRNLPLRFLLAALAGGWLVPVLALPGDAGISSPHEKGRMQLTSTAFAPGGSIPQKYTCQGADVSPPLRWADPPANTESFALIVDDPDAPAGTWVHWVVFDLPPGSGSLAENASRSGSLGAGAREGLNDFRRAGYGGPCPPPGNPHHYFFRLYALDRRLGLNAGATKAEVERAMANHVLSRSEYVGVYERK